MMSLRLPLLGLLLTLSIDPANAEMSAREIMQQVKDRDTGSTATMDMAMLLIDSKGNQRERSIRSFQRDVPDRDGDTQSIMFFLGPANVKDTGFLSYDYDDGRKDDDQWLYLPALKKVKRIAAADKSGSFMGSDFTYADMSSPDLEAYEYQLMKIVDIKGHKHWQILSTPKTEAEIERTGYKKSVAFIRQDNYVVMRSVNFLADGKRMKYMEVKKLSQIDGIWTAQEISMSTKKGKQTEHASVLRWHNVQYNLPLSDELFSQRRLSQGL
ncbi:MAG: outer membrane lipoprotein-sorting protein [Oceanococcus sp.]